MESLPSGSTIVDIGPARGLPAQIKRIRSDLDLVGLIERERRDTENPDGFEDSLRLLSEWVKPSTIESIKPRSLIHSDQLNFFERYPDLWGDVVQFKVPSWKDFETSAPSDDRSNAKTIRYNLVKEPWVSIRDHVIRGRISSLRRASSMHSGLSKPVKKVLKISISTL